MLHPSSCTILSRYVFSTVVFLAPVVAFAEVSDKEPSLLSIWVIGIIAALVCFVASYFLKWYGTIVAVFPLFWFALHFIELHSSDIGKALYLEQGAGYFIQSYLAAFLVLIGVIAGVFFNKNLKKTP